MKKLLMVVISVTFGIVIGLFGSKVVGDYKEQEMQNREAAWIERIEDQNCDYIGKMNKNGTSEQYVFLTIGEDNYIDGVELIDKCGSIHWYGRKTDEYNSITDSMLFIE